MIILVRFGPLPHCKYCGEQMTYWVPGLPDDEHMHPECYGKARAAQALESFKKVLEQHDRAVTHCKRLP